MKEILSYALCVVVCSGLFTVFYRMVLHRTTSFLAARIYLLISLVCAAIIPALNIPVWSVAPIEIPLIAQSAGAHDIAEPAVSASSAPVDWIKVTLWIIWSAGITVMVVITARQAGNIARIKRRAVVFCTDGCKIALSEDISAPFSFLSTVFIEKGTPEQELRQIILHEASHIRHRHSQEKIAMETLKSVLWFNPFAWWAARLLGEVHEFEADRDVLDGGFTIEEYLPLIFRRTFGYIPELSVGLGDSLTKKRFLMMKNKMKPKKYSWLRVIGVLPLAAGMMLLFSFTSRPPEIIFTETRTVVEPVGKAIVDEPLPTVQKPDEDKPLTIVDVMPKFQEGELMDFRYWVNRNIRYPKEAAERNIKGKVIVTFIVERDGSVTIGNVSDSPDKILTDEVVRVLKESPKWTPGINKGERVRVFFHLPVDFGLQDEPAAKSPAKDTVKPEEKLKELEALNEQIALKKAKEFGARQPELEAQRPSTMDDIRVIGYATSKKSDINGLRLDSISLIGINTDVESPLIILDWTEITSAQMATLDPTTIKDISVLRGATAKKHFGERAKDGAVIITSKTNGDIPTRASINKVKVITGNDAVKNVIASVKNQLRSFGVTKISYTLSNGETETTDVE